MKITEFCHCIIVHLNLMFTSLYRFVKYYSDLLIILRSEELLPYIENV